MVLAKDLGTCQSILKRLPVRVGNLDRFFLHRALRGDFQPSDEEYLTVTTQMLYAVYEAGPDTRKSKKG